MTDGTTGIVLIIVFAALLLAAIGLGRGTAQPSNGDVPLHSRVGVSLPPDDLITAPDAVAEGSALMPLGWGMIVIGSLVALWAWFFMDITPVDYSNTVNIDAVSQRSMLHTAGLVFALTGVVTACAGHAVNEVRRKRL